MARKNEFKKRIGVVYSTDDSYEYAEDEQLEEETLAPGDQKLRVKQKKKKWVENSCVIAL